MTDKEWTKMFNNLQKRIAKYEAAQNIQNQQLNSIVKNLNSPHKKTDKPEAKEKLLQKRIEKILQRSEMLDEAIADHELDNTDLRGGDYE